MKNTPMVLPADQKAEEGVNAATATSRPVTVTPSAVFTSTAEKRKVRETDCIEVGEKQVPETKEGTLVLLNLLDDKQFYMMRLPSGEKLIKVWNPIERIIDIRVSPDLTKIAVASQNFNKDRLSIFDAEGKVLVTRNYYPLAWWNFLGGWVNNEQLLTSTLKMSQEGVFIYPEEAFLYDAKTDKKTSLNNQQLPDLLKPIDPFVWNNVRYSEATYNFDLSRAVYARKDGQMVLWDLINQKEITRFPGIFRSVDGPVWSPSGDKFAVFSPSDQEDWNNNSILALEDEELWLVDKDGHKKRLTYLAESENRHFLSNITWSPDGEKIALWIHSNNDWRSRLAVFDLKSNVLTNYCIAGPGDDAWAYWSPDGNSVAIPQKITQGMDDIFITVIVDFKKHQAYVVDEENGPAGWMKE